MRITNLQVYDMHNSIRASGYPMKARLDKSAIQQKIKEADERAERLYGRKV